MTDNHFCYGSVPSRLSSDQYQPSQEASRRSQEPVITSLPPLRPSKLTPRQISPRQSLSIDVYGADNKSLYSTFDNSQPTASWAAAEGPPLASATYQQMSNFTSARDSDMASYSPARSPSLFPSPIDHNRRRIPIPKSYVTAPWKSLGGAGSSVSTEYMPGPQPMTSSPRLRGARGMPDLKARASSNTNSQSQGNYGGLFVEQGDPVRGNSLLNHPAAPFPAPSSPLRIPSSPGDNHIGNLRVAAKLESRTYKTGFFPETELSNEGDSIFREDKVIEKALTRTQVSGFILEDDDFDGSPQGNKMVLEARAGGKHLKKSKSKQADNVRLAASRDNAGVLNSRPSQTSPILVEREHVATSQGILSQYRRSMKR
ncbi:uncharacterized protein ColSpa_11785 [Colletotrichum spaethianum]|uniref:Uncharacterized protein n=1 Tax=Colletotrichum spaethianum TaxID=700344 RepID=A0AA37PG46_9PEZI|nr:uncharacterized protein ColSpa_11785 [Colletotrichum spaethianum]GKT51604.1 hypothetical protein ColSpa_11785 [Colletotrichum spaethianum]